jgi:alpha-L-fucosidase
VKDVRPYESTDIRFTTKGEALYTFCMNQPTDDIKITSLGKNSKMNEKVIASITMLGSKEKLEWKQEADALVISKPSKMPKWQVLTFKVKFKQ